MDEDSSTDQKTWQVYSLGNSNVFRLHFNETSEGFCWRGRGRSFHVDRSKTGKTRERAVETGKTREPAVESLVRGIWRLRGPEAERRVREGV